MAETYTARVLPTISEGVYASSFIDISDFVLDKGVPKISQSIDSTDYDYGLFKYGDITLKCKNLNGILGDINDSRSIFNLNGRDKAKVEIVYRKDILNDDGETIRTDTISFKGIINEEATRFDIVDDIISFKVLALDSVIRNNKVSGGTIPNGALASTAIKSILNVPKITAVLGFSASNINVDQDFIIDDGSDFDNNTNRTALNKLLVATNSVLLIDSSDNIIVKSRLENTVKDVLNLYGENDLLGRENIIKIKGYNPGNHRMFNSVKLDTWEEGNVPLQQQFGTRQKSVNLDFITTEATGRVILRRLLREFKAPKIELTVTVPTNVALNVELLDRVSINHPLRIGAPADGEFLPVIGVTKIGDSDSPLPRQFGSIAISPLIAFKVIGIAHRSARLETELKLRQVGVELNDGQFNVAGNCLIGSAIIGDCQIGVGSTDPFNPSVLGAAQVGSTKIA